MLRVPLPPRDVYYIILRPIFLGADFFDICHKQMLIYDYITFVQLFVKEYVNYKQCLNSLQTALVSCKVIICICDYFIIDTS